VKMNAQSSNLCRVLLAVWLALFVLFGLTTLTTYPPVNYNIADEIWALNGSTAFVGGERVGGVVTPRLYFYALGTFMNIAGHGVAQARAFSIIMATLTLLFTFLLGRELLDEYTGLAASVLLGTTFAFTWHSSMIRNEMMTAAFITGAVYLVYHAFKSGKRWPLFLGSLVAALSVNVHPNSLQHAIAIIPVFLVIYRRKAASSAALYFFGGLLAGFLVWLAFSYYPALSESAQSAGLVAGITKVSPFPVLRENFFALFTKSLKQLVDDYVKYVRLYDFFYPNVISISYLAGAVLFVLGVSMFTAQRLRVLAITGLVVLTNFIIYFITDRYGFWHMIELYPFMAIAVALGLRGIGHKLPGKAGVAVFAAATLAIAAMGVSDTAIAYYKMKDYDYGRFLHRVAEKVDGKVMGMDLYSPAFANDEFVGQWFNTDRPYTTCGIFDTELKKRGVKYIIADDVLRSVVRRACGKPYETDVLRYLNLHCKAVDRITEGYPSYWAPGGMIREVYVFRVPD